MGIQHGNILRIRTFKNMKHAPKWPNPLISGPNSRFKAADAPSLWGVPMGLRRAVSEAPYRIENRAAAWFVGGLD